MPRRQYSRKRRLDLRQSSISELQSYDVASIVFLVNCFLSIQYSRRSLARVLLENRFIFGDHLGDSRSVIFVDLLVKVVTSGSHV
jgi:hypothetical protein